MHKIILLLIITITLSACSKTKKNAIDKGVITDEYSFVNYALYLNKDDSLAYKKMVELINKGLPQYKIIDSLNSEMLIENSIYVEEATESKNNFIPADSSSLPYFGQGLTKDNEIALLNSNHSIYLLFTFKQNKYAEQLTKINDMILQLNGQHKAIIYDIDTREYYSSMYWENNKLIKNNTVDISQHITVHFYRHGNFNRMITLGMSKFGLPDLCINSVTQQAGPAALSLINLTAQTLLEKGELKSKGTLSLNIDELENEELKMSLKKSSYENSKGECTIELVKGKWEDGDPENRIVEIAFSTETPQIAHDELLSRLFGSADNVIGVEEDNYELNKASEAVKTKIPQLQEMFLKGLQLNQTLLMKFPFDNDTGEREYMWVSVVKWKDNDITGILTNGPRVVTSLKSGQSVTKNVNEMFDYILNNPDGTSEGNTTGEIIKKMYQ